MRKLIMLALLAAGIAAVIALPAAAKPGGTNGKIVVNVDNSVTGQEQVYTVDPDGTDPQFLANDTEAGQWSPDGTKIAIRIVDLGHNVAQDVDHHVIPLAVEFEADWARLRRNITRALQVFGDGNLARLPRLSVAVRRIDFLK